MLVEGLASDVTDEIAPGGPRNRRNRKEQKSSVRREGRRVWIWTNCAALRPLILPMRIDLDRPGNRPGTL